MKKILLMATLLLCLIQFSNTLLAADSPMTAIENPVLVCESEGAKYAFEGFERRVWQGDPGVEEGLEFTILSFKQVKRIAYDWRVKAELEFMEQKMEYKLRTYSKIVLDDNGSASFNVKLNVFIKNPETSKYQKVLNKIPCQTSE